MSSMDKNGELGGSVLAAILVGAGEAGALAGVVAFVVCQVMGLAEGGGWEGCLACGTFEAVAVH
jgi:hypothetical protein